MKIIFCNIANMDYYQGITDADKPKNGGSYVEETKDALESHNFSWVKQDNYNEMHCLGFYETKSTGTRSNNTRIERISKEISTKDPSIDNVLVVWCALHEDGTRVIGWYKHATVFRQYQSVSFSEHEDQSYNVTAKSKDCTLLPKTERIKEEWKVPRSRGKKGYGFGQANIWYAEEPAAKKFASDMIGFINGYSGENWLEKGNNMKTTNK